MSTLDRIRDIIYQIIDETDVRKPDIFCSEYIFLGLTKRADCQLHPTQTNTIIMLPNVYWAIDPQMTIPNVIANTRRGELLMQYLELADYLMLEERGSIVDIQRVVREIINQRK